MLNIVFGVHVCMCVPLVYFYASSFRSMSFLNFETFICCSHILVSLFILQSLSFSLCFSRFYAGYKDFLLCSVFFCCSTGKKVIYITSTGCLCGTGHCVHTLEREIRSNIECEYRFFLKFKALFWSTLRWIWLKWCGH